MEIEKLIKFLKSMTGYCYQGRSSIIEINDVINFQLGSVKYLKFHFTVYSKENIKKDMIINYNNIAIK